MDQATIKWYNYHAPTKAAHYRHQRPVHLYNWIDQFFQKNEPTVDIGCGSGRDTNWLSHQGFPVTGIDHLPDLHLVENGKYNNILCNAVLMHINDEHLEEACHNLSRIAAPKARILISIRDTEEADNREEEKLYNPICLDELTNLMNGHRFKPIHQEEYLETRRQLNWSIIIFERK